MKKRLRIVLKLLKWILIGVFSPILIYLLVGLIFTFIPTNPKAIDCKMDNQIHFSSSIIHVDIVLPVDLVDTAISKGLNIPNNTKYIGFGWGDEAFYLETRTWADMSMLTAFKSLAIKTPSAMHITYHKRLGKDWKTKNICLEQAQSINAHILSGFELDENQSFKFVEDGYAKNDFFYEGKGAYTGIKTCNTWVNQAMKKAKIKTARWTPFNFGILRYV